MPVAKHEHKKDCPMNDDSYYMDYLVKVSPDFLWFHIQDVGSYQGSVYAVGLHQNKLVIYEDYYGSCGGCGAWGEGGEPESQEAVLKRSAFFNTVLEAIEHIAKMSKYDAPDSEKLINALKEADKFRNG